MDTTEAVLVRIQNVHDYFLVHSKEHGWQDLRSFLCVKPPFTSLLVSYDHSFNVGYDADYQQVPLTSPVMRHICMSIDELSMDTFRTEYMDPEPERYPEMPQLIEYVEAVKPNTVLLIQLSFDMRILPGRWFIFLDATGKVLVHDPFGWLYVNTPEEMANITRRHIPIDDLQMTFCRHGCIALAALTFMNCKNVEILDNPPSRQQRRQAERQGRPKPVTYKTLVIHPFQKVRKNEGPSVPGLPGVSLHICRGHFKDFRSGPGLGKGHAHGLWWWSPQVRGTPEAGRVVKDYSVVADG